MNQITVLLAKHGQFQKSKQSIMFVIEYMETFHNIFLIMTTGIIWNSLNGKQR